MLPVPLLHKPHTDPVKHPRDVMCGKCHIWHPCKVLHLSLDSDGAVIVSPEIWADLQRTANSGGFTMANRVEKPPSQTIAPPTMTIKLEGVDLAGTLAHQPRRAETFVPVGKRSTTRDAQPGHRTVTVDEYVDTVGAMGLNEAGALNLLMSKVLAEGPAVKG
jgi:hypothetical protein